ncbi:17699_t:CDS:10, partial [Gigaspora margarita]
DTWEAINNALQGPQAIWLIGVGDETQRISQFVLENENIINEKKRLILLESLKVVDLAEQIFGANHAGSRLANKINEWYPISGKINDDIKRACIEHEHGQEECALWFNRFGHPTHHLVQVAVNGKLLKDDITGFVQAPIVLLQYLLGASILEDLTVGEVIISLTKQTKVWLPNNRDISCAIIGKFIQGSKIDEKRLTHRLVTDEDELDFLIKDCTNAGTFAGREKCPLGFILTYYKGHQPQYTHLRASMLAYAHINLLKMLRRFKPNKVVRITTDSIYVRKEALYKIKNVSAFFKQEKAKDSDLCPHTYPLCAMCTDPEEFFISKSEYAKWIKEFLKTKMPLEIQPGQWHDKGEKKYGPNADIIYWPKNRYWKSIKDITKNINMVVFTHTNALAKDFQNDRKVKAQTWYSFFRWNGVGEWNPECIGEKKFPRVVIWDKAKCSRLQELKKKIRHQNNRVQLDLFHEALPVAKKWKYLESEWKPSDHGCKQNCLVQISSSSEKKELVKNDIIYLPLNTLSDKFLQGMLGKEKAIDWELGYTMTIHTSQGMTLKAPQRVWVIDEHLAWDNLIYLAVGHVEYLGQLIQIEEYMNQDKKKGREFNLFEWDEAGNPDQWTVDRIDNKL